MIFPMRNLRTTPEPDDALDRINRAVHDRNHRLSAGISMSRQFDNVQGALVVSQGNGKYVRVRHVVAASAAISKSIRTGCVDVFHGRLRDRGQISQLVSDLAEPQATVVEQLKCQAGKYVDRVLAVAVCDPGIWDQDFDGRISYAPFCDAMRLAELSGVTVIDAFPARDLAVGGDGNHLESLPYWIMFGDRDPRIASQSRLLVSIEDDCGSYFLPASDGLDSEVPRVTTSESTGLGFLNEIIRRRYPQTPLPSALDRLYADGLQVPALGTQWAAILAESRELSGDSKPNSSIWIDSQALAEGVDLPNRLADVAESYLKQNDNGFSNVFRTGIRWIVDECLRALPSGGNDEWEQLLLSCPAWYEASFINEFTNLLSGKTVMTTRQAGIDQCQLDSVVAALLGLFHIDQMPASIPWLTGAHCQRILGRLTPGRPSNWRQLVRVMADFQPAPMKLKDAI